MTLPVGWGLLLGAPVLTRTGLAPARKSGLSGRSVCCVVPIGSGTDPRTLPTDLNPPTATSSGFLGEQPAAPLESSQNGPKASSETPQCHSRPRPKGQDCRSKCLHFQAFPAAASNSP